MKFVTELNRTPSGISTKAHPIPGYGYEVRTDVTELTELSGTGMAYRTHRTIGYG